MRKKLSSSTVVMTMTHRHADSYLFPTVIQSFFLFLCTHPWHFYSFGSLRLAFSWMMGGFSGYLDPREVLLLWDRVIGHNSLTIIAGELRK